MRAIVRVALSAVVGFVLSISPPELFLPLLGGSVAFVAFQTCRHGWRHGATLGLPAGVVIAICALWPCKPLDVVVGPMKYDEMALSELCEQLYTDHGIVCQTWYLSSKNERLSFSTDRPMSRRDVLRKLSHDTNRPLRIAYCGTGATILWGARPSFTSLGEREPAKER